MSLHILNDLRAGQWLLRSVLCTTWILLAGGCMLGHSSGVTERVSPLAPAEHKPVLINTNVVAATPPVETSSRVIEMQHRIDELAEMLAASYQQQYDLQHKDGELQAMEKKAQWSDALNLELKTLSAKTETLNTELAENKKLLAEMTAKAAVLHARTNELEHTIAEITGKLGPIEDTMRQLRMGNFEYYTVHPGDTCNSIAAQPLIYGDEAKQTAIRQANRGQVPDLDNLTPGEVLIIPRPKGEAVREL